MTETAAAPEAPVAKWANRILGEAMVDPAVLKANPLNFRTHGADQQRALTGAIERIGWIQRVVVNKRTGTIVDGHLRAQLAIKHGEQIPVIYVDLDDIEERIALASLDPIAAMAGQDDANLAALLAGIEAGNQQLDTFLDTQRALLANQRAPKPGKTDPDDAPPPPVRVRTTVGETWLLGPHRLQVGDATDPAVVAKAMGGQLAQVVWTDPPYNVNYEGTDGMKIANDSMGDAAFRTFLTKLLGAALAHTQAGGPIYIAHADSEGLNFRQAAIDAGWSLRQCLVWVKNAFVMGRQDYQWQHEPILYGWKPGAAHRWFGARNKSTVIDDRVDIDSLGKADLRDMAKRLIAQAHPTVIDCPKPGRNDIHPTMKPVALLHATLGNSALPDDHVLDVCGGSGSTLIAAEQLQLIAHLVELDPRYADAIITRWQTFTGKTAYRLADQVAFDHLTPPRSAAMTIPASPLQWPAGWERTQSFMRTTAKFGKASRNGGRDGRWTPGRALTISEAVERVRSELKRMGVDEDDLVINSDLKLRLDGFPRSDQREPDDPGVAVYWLDRGNTRCMAIDRYNRVADNLAAVAATLEAMRAIERHGGATILDRAFTGFTALPSSGESWWGILGVDPNARQVEIDAAYRRKRSEAHPDRGGSVSEFDAVQRAYEQGKSRSMQ